MIPGYGRSPGEGNGNPLQYSCLENSMDRGAWWATVHEVAELDMTEPLIPTNTKARRTGNSYSEDMTCLMAFREKFLKATFRVRVHDF